MKDFDAPPDERAVTWREVLIISLAVGFVTGAIIVLWFVLHRTEQLDCTGYKDDPIYRPGQYGAMIREDRYTCVEWGTR